MAAAATGQHLHLLQRHACRTVCLQALHDHLGLRSILKSFACGQQASPHNGRKNLNALLHALALQLLLLELCYQDRVRNQKPL
ncbi:hypothetical protein [Stenotrophomonas indicatrix]|uniref:hypothetical protein n=1 Tax=Stenotrophomonas indicatrix TaxID=2045451 RepID=UPI0028AD1A92|nr:hypothetical protein [Stenotrophomonas indicatrix]